jgi:glycosyltransferase involved in cell wall biosynthesis
MKIAILSANLFDDSIGGVENHILFISRELVKRGQEIVFFKPVWEDKFKQTERKWDDNLTIYYINVGKRPYDLRRWSGQGKSGYLIGFMGKAAYILAARKIARAIASWNPELVWQHDFSSGWLATRKLARRFPVVLTNHSGEYLMLNRLVGGRIFLRWALKHYKAVIGPSKELTPDFLKKSITIHNGVDTSVFCPLSTEERLGKKIELFGGADRFAVFCPRRWAPSKGIIFLAKAIRQLNDADDLKSKLVFAFAGDDTRYPVYTKKIESQLAGLDVKVNRLGDLGPDEVVPYYQSADLVVIPSLMEAVSLAALEAMACGTPVLSTRVGGMPEIITEAKTGYLVNPGQSEELAHAIQTIFNEPERVKVAEEALKRVRRQYDWSAIAQATETVLKEALHEWQAMNP